MGGGLHHRCRPTRAARRRRPSDALSCTRAGSRRRRRSPSRPPSTTRPHLRPLCLSPPFPILLDASFTQPPHPFDSRSPSLSRRRSAVRVWRLPRRRSLPRGAAPRPPLSRRARADVWYVCVPVRAAYRGWLVPPSLLRLHRGVLLLCSVGHVRPTAWPTASSASPPVALAPRPFPPPTSRQPPPVHGGRQASRVASSRCSATAPPWTCSCSCERRCRGGSSVWRVRRCGRRYRRTRRQRTGSPPTPADVPAPAHGEVRPAAARGGFPPTAAAVCPWRRRATAASPAVPPFGAPTGSGWRVRRSPAASFHSNTPSGRAASWWATAAACPTTATGGGGGSGGTAAAAAASGSGTTAAAPAVGDVPAAAPAAAAAYAVPSADRAASHLIGAAEPDRATTAGARFSRLPSGAAAAAAITALSVQPSAAKCKRAQWRAPRCS